MTQRLPFVIMAFLSLLVALGSWRFLVLPMALSFPDLGAHIAE